MTSRGRSIEINATTAYPVPSLWCPWPRLPSPLVAEAMRPSSCCICPRAIRSGSPHHHDGTCAARAWARRPSALRGSRRALELQWAWAPLVDLGRSQRFGPSRAWIVSSQTMMILTIAVVLLFDPAAQLGLVTSLIIVHNVVAATQGIAIDALAVRGCRKQLGDGQRAHVRGCVAFGQAIGGSGALSVAASPDTTRRSFMLARSPSSGAISPALLEPASAAPAPPPVVRPRAGAGRGAFARLRLFLVDLYASFSARPPAAARRRVRHPAAGGGRARARALYDHGSIWISQAQIPGLSLLSSSPAAFGCVAGGWVSDRVGHRDRWRLYALTACRRCSWPGACGAREALGLDARLCTVVAACSRSPAASSTAPATTCSWALERKVAATQFTGYMALKNLALNDSDVRQGWMASTHGYARSLLIDGIGAGAAWSCRSCGAPATGRRAGADGPACAGGVNGKQRYYLIIHCTRGVRGGTSGQRASGPRRE